MDFDFISADNHLDVKWLPHDVWQSRVSARFKDVAPKVVENEEGTFWSWEGKVHQVAADGKANAAHRKRNFGLKGIETPEDCLPPTDTAFLLDYMARQSVYSMVFYGEPHKWHHRDPLDEQWYVADEELLVEIYRALNDYLIEFSASAPDRIIALPVLPTMYPELCADELRRVATAGAKGAEFNLYDMQLPIHDPAWEPLWTAAEEFNIPICCHIGGDAAGERARLATDRPAWQLAYTDRWDPTGGAALAHYSYSSMGMGRYIAELIFSGALDRHPGLRFSFGECRVSWFPFLITWMDRNHRLGELGFRPADPKIKLSRKPSEFVKDQITLTFDEDYFGARLMAEPWGYLADCSLWGGDFPHGQGIWDNTGPILEKMFAEVPADIKHWVTYEHSREFFGIAKP